MAPTSSYLPDVGFVPHARDVSDANDRADLAARGPDADAADMVEIPPPEPPPALTRWITGADDDAEVDDSEPGLILMGGGVEPDEAFHWMRDRMGGGDVVVLRVTGSDGYNDYLFEDIGGFDSVETLRVDTTELADDPYVAHRVDRAEAVFLAGGDQWHYLSIWRDTRLHAALCRVAERGAVLGGTSAGLAVLGDRAFSAENDTVYSDEALADPFNEFMRFEDDYLDLPQLAGTITDSHFRERDRMGRLVTFVARMWVDGWVDPVGIGIDESTALLIGPAGRSVVGPGAVYEVRSDAGPEHCVTGEPLTFRDVHVTRTTAADTTDHVLSVVEGELDQPHYQP